VDAAVPFDLVVFWEPSVLLVPADEAAAVPLVLLVPELGTLMPEAAGVVWFVL